MRAIHKKKRKHGGGGPSSRPRGRRGGSPRPGCPPARSAPRAAAPEPRVPPGSAPRGARPAPLSGDPNPAFGKRTGGCAGFARQKAVKWEIHLSCLRGLVRTLPVSSAAPRPLTATYRYNGRSAPPAIAMAVAASFIKSARANTDIANRNATARRLQQSTLNFPITRKVSKYFIFLFQSYKELGSFLTNIYLLRPKCISV